MAYLNAWNEEENEISIDLHDQPLSKKQKTVAFARETAIAAKEAIHLHDQSTFLRNDNSDCVTNEESQLTQEWEKLAKDPQWRIVKNVMDPTFYHSQAGSDRQALHELQESQPKLNPTKAFETAIRDIDTRLPPRFREGAIRLISILYHKSKSHTFTIHFLQEFYDDDHWIVRKYEKIRKKKNTRDFLLEKFVVNQFDFIKKTPEQMEEVKNISDMARIMYIMLMEFAPWNKILLS